MAWVLIEEKPNYQVYEDSVDPTKRQLITTKRVFGRKDIEVDGTLFTVHHPSGDFWMDIATDDVYSLEGGTLKPVLEEFVVDTWVPRAKGTPTSNFGQRSVTMYDVTTSNAEDTGKMTFSVKPGNGTYRLKITSTPNITGTPTIKTSTNWFTEVTTNVGVLYPSGFRGSWFDMQDDVETIDATSARTIITTFEFTITSNETVTFDPTFGPSDATYSVDCTSSIEDDSDADDLVGRPSGSYMIRTAIKWDITSLPATATVTNVACTVEVNSFNNGSGTFQWMFGPYNGDGQADPDPDSGSTLYNRCDVSSDNYLNSLTAYRTTGNKSHTDLGTTAEADVEAARDVGTRFSMAWRLQVEDSSWDYTVFDSVAGSGVEPTLTIDYTTAPDTTHLDLDRGFNRGICSGFHRGMA